MHLIVNIDASQFKVGNSSDGRVEVKYIVDGGGPAGSKSVPDNSSIVAYFIKYFLLIIPDGSSGPPVYVIANSNTPIDKIYCYTIPGWELVLKSCQPQLSSLVSEPPNHEYQDLESQLLASLKQQITCSIIYRMASFFLYI